MPLLKIEHITPEENSLSTIQTNIPCEVEGCNKTFKSMSVLKFHQSQSHQYKRLKKINKDLNIEERFHCPVKDCIYFFSASTLSRYFEKMQYLKQHYLKVHGACSFPCDRCSKSFSTKFYLRAHQLYCDLDIVCSCGQKFGCITSLQTHVKRKGHEAEVLEVYSSRLCKNKLKVEVSKSREPSQNRFILPKSEPSCSFTNSLISVPQQGHLNAAIALSELAFAGLKRISTVEVGVQTDSAPSKRLSRKSSSSSHSREPQSKKRKQTTEMETQTQLTNLKGKVRRRGNAKRISKCIATDTNIPTTLPDLKGSLIYEVIPTVFKCDLKLECSYDTCTEVEASCSSGGSSGLSSGLSSGGGMFKNSINRDHLVHKKSSLYHNSSATQTTIAMDFDVFVPGQDTSLPYDFFRDDGTCKEENEQPESENIFEDNTVETQTMGGSTDMNGTHHQQNHFSSPQILIDDDDSLVVGMNHSVGLSPMISHRAPILSSQNRSSSIETQTEHDVFLNTHFPTPDDADDIILTSSETQTCENFSDIEPFLCSFIDTQTVDDHHSSSELFPELNFTSDMQTQTCTDESPNFVTTHTQTSIFGLSGS